MRHLTRAAQSLQFAVTGHTSTCCIINHTVLIILNLYWRSHARQVDRGSDRDDWFSAAAPPEEAPASLCLSHALEHAAACRTDWSYGIAEPHVCYTLSHHATATSRFHIKLLAKGHRTDCHRSRRTACSVRAG